MSLYQAQAFLFEMLLRCPGTNLTRHELGVQLWSHVMGVFREDFQVPTRASYWDGPFLARLNGPPSRGLYGPKVACLAAKQQTGVVLLFHYITANFSSMARLCNAARAIFGPPGICKWEGLAVRPEVEEMQNFLRWIARHIVARHERTFPLQNGIVTFYENCTNNMLQSMN